MSDEDKENLIGRTILSISNDNDSITIKFTDNTTLHIDSNANAHDDSGLTHWLEIGVFKSK